MSEHVWYYAHGDSEKGPLTTPQIKALAAAGKIHPDDFVWKEGMETWAPARDLKELFGNGARGAQVVDEQGNHQTSARLAAFGASGPPSQTRPAPYGYLTFSVGLVLVLVSRGCDSLGDRYVDRLRSVAAAEQTRFEDDWNERRRTITNEQATLANLANRTPAQTQRLNQLNQQLADFSEQSESARQRHEADIGAAQRNAVRSADDANHMWGFWREVAFLTGSLVLSGGLLAVALTSPGPDRWVCLLLLGALLHRILD